MGARKVRILFILCLIAPVLIGCVGPTTPFGAINEVTVKEKSQEKTEVKVSKRFEPKISFYPDRQVLHGRTNFSTYHQ